MSDCKGHLRGRKTPLMEDKNSMEEQQAAPDAASPKRPGPAPQPRPPGLVQAGAGENAPGQGLLMCEESLTVPICSQPRAGALGNNLEIPTTAISLGLGASLSLPLIRDPRTFYHCLMSWGR